MNEFKKPMTKTTDWDLQRFIFLKRSLSESSGAFPGVAADEGLPGHPVEECQNHDDVSPVSYCVRNGFAVGLTGLFSFKAPRICFWQEAVHRAGAAV